MQQEKITIDTIINYLTEQVENKQPVDAHTWVDAAQKLNMLLGNEHEKLFDLQQKISLMRVALLEIGDTPTRAKMKVESTDEYKQMQIQRAFILRIEEMIRISKVQARLHDEELKGYR